ncbi:hypothetical protein FF1_022582 [Malus domestica]
MAKPAIFELNGSIIQAGGAPTQNVLSSEMISIQESLESSDWTTLKAACIALGEIASSGGSFMGSFKASCVRSLESCRFDKFSVKPVRDTVLQALQCWKSLPGPDASEPSEAGSSIKENFFGGDYSDITSARESGWKDLALKKVITGLTKSRAPLSIKKTCPSFGKSHKRSNEDDWHFEVAVPKTHNASLPEFQNEESEDVTSTQDIGYEYVPMDEKEQCSSGSNLVSDDLEGKFVTHSRVKGSSQKPVGRNQRFAAEEIGSEKQMYSERIHHRRSLDSTVTESSSHTPHGCCLQMANEVVCIRKQLVEIETKQSNLMDLLQVLTSGILDSLSVFQTRVVGLEDVVNRLAQYFEHRREHSNLAASKLMKQRQNLRSPRLSTSIPRPSIDMTSRQPSMLSVKHSDTWEANTIGRSRTNNSAGHCTETWSNNRGKLTRNPIGKDIRKIPGQGTQRISNGPTRADAMFSSASNAKVRQNVVDSKNNLWKQVKGFLCEGDLDSAYVEALCSGDEIVLVELLEGTGPVLECLLPKTARDVLSTLASYLLEQRFINIIIPWLQQASAFIHYLCNIADLSTKRVPNYLGLPAKAKQEFLFSMEESLNMEFSNPSERRSVTQLAVKLHHLWGNFISMLTFVFAFPTLAFLTQS